MAQILEGQKDQKDQKVTFSKIHFFCCPANFLKTMSKIKMSGRSIIHFKMEEIVSVGGIYKEESLFVCLFFMQMTIKCLQNSAV